MRSPKEKEQLKKKVNMRLRSEHNFDYSEANSFNQYFKRLQFYQRFYIEVFPNLIKPLNRSSILSFLLLLISTIQEASLIINNSQNLNTDPNSQTVLLYYFNKTLGKQLLDRTAGVSKGIAGLVIIFGAINLFITLAVCTSILLYLFASKSKRAFLLISKMCAFFCTFYNYIIFVPTMNLSFWMMSSSSSSYQFALFFAYVNIPLSFIIGICITYHDLDYTFIGKDWLARRDSKLEILRQLILSTVCYLNVQLNEDVLAIVLLHYSLFKLSLYYREQFFLRKNISCFYFMLCCCLCSFSLLMTFNYLFKELKNIGVLLLFQLGLSARLGYDIYSRYQQNLLSLCMGKTDLNFLPLYQVDIFVRSLNENLSLFFEDYIEKGKAVIFENIFISHKLNCDARDYKCFCYEFKREDNSFSLEEYIGQDYRRKFIFQYTASVYESVVNAKLKTNTDIDYTMLSYISYLFEMMNISTRSYSVVYAQQGRTFSKMGLNLKNQQSMNIIFARLNKQFEHFFNNPKIQNQRIKMMYAIDFDEYIKIFRTATREYLINLGQHYDFLCSNYISLQELEIRSAQLLEQYKYCQKLHQRLFDINPLDKQLQYITAIYTNVLDFQNRRVLDFISKSQKITEQFILPEEREQLKLFTANSCIVYASLNEYGGVIKRVSKNFTNIFEFHNQNMINKSISQIVPRGMFGDHDDFVNNFNIKGTMSIINTGERMVFGYNARGFIFPVMIRLKLENLLGELGICGQLTRLFNIHEYLFLDDKNHIVDITEDLYKTVFSSIYSKNYLPHLNITQIIPIVTVMKELNEFDLSYHTIMVIPRESKNSQRHHEAIAQDGSIKSTHLKNLQNCVDSITDRFLIFNVDVSLKQIRTLIGKVYYFLEITHITRVYGFDEKRTCIDKLKECVEAFGEYDKEAVHGKPFKEINNLRFEQLRKIDQMASYTKLSIKKNESYSESFFTTEEAQSDEITIKKKNYKDKRAHTNERDLLQFANQVLSQHGSLSSPNLSPTNKNQSIERMEDFAPLASRGFNLELTKVPYPEYFQQNDLNHTDILQLEPQMPFSPKEVSHRQLLSHDIASQGDEELYIKEQYSSEKDKKMSYISNEISKSKTGVEQEQQTASRSNYQNLSQGRKSQKSVRSIKRKEARKKTTKLLLKKYESNQRFHGESSNAFSQDNEGEHHGDNDKGDIQSVRASNASMNEQKKKQIIHKMGSTNNSIIVKIFLSVVLISFIILIIVSSIQYKELTNSIDAYYYDFLQLNIFNQVNDITLVLLSQRSFQDLFREYQKLSVETNNQTFLATELNSSSTYFKNQYTNLLEKYLRTEEANSNQNYYSVYLQNTTVLNLTDIELLTGSTPDLREVTIIYEFLIYMQQVNQMLIDDVSMNFDDSVVKQMNFFWDNYPNIFTTSYAVQGVIEDQVKQEFNYIDQVQLLNLIVLLIFVAVLVMSIIPMEILGKMQIERILKLFGSFPPDKLQKYVDLIEYCIVKIDEMSEMQSFSFKQLEDVLKQNINQILTMHEQKMEDSNIQNAEDTLRNKFSKMVSVEKLNIIHRLPNKRNRSLASFNSLKKINIILIGLSVLVIFVLMIYPVVSLLIIAQYKSEGQLVISERISIFDATSVLLDYHANHYGYWLTNYRNLQAPSDQINYRMGTIFASIQNLHSSGDSYLQKVSNIVNNQNIERREMTKYKEIFLTMLNSDVCSVASAYPQYFDPKMFEVDCGEIMDGILNRGFIITMNSISQFFKSYLQVYLSLQNSPSPSSDLMTGLLMSQNNTNIIDGYNQLLRILKISALALDNFIVESQTNYYNYILTINQGLFIMQILIIILTFLFGWSFFYKKFTQKLNETKDLVKLFHINLIIDNKIFMTFFKKNKQSLT